MGKMRIKLKMKIFEIYGRQNRFAVCCGKSQAWLSNIINGITNPTEEDKQILCTKLKINKDDPEYLEL